MASVEDQGTVDLKLLVDEKRNKVVAAEADKDFVDILLGFLTLPLGTIVRATRNQPGGSRETEIPVMFCMQKLYESVEKLSTDYFTSETCKTFLLNPRNPLAAYCLNLKVNLDDFYPDTYFQCSSFRPDWMYLCGYCDYSQVKCSCGGTFNKQAFLQPPHSADNYHGAFIKGKMTFIITDDLRVTTNSPSSLVQLFSNLGFNDVTQITEMSVAAGLKEIKSLLRCSLISKSPLTDVFLHKKGKINHTNILPEPGYAPSSHIKATTNITLSLNIILRKSTNRVLFAEADSDFVDFLLSFFTFPLGSVVQLLDGNSGLGCADNLSRSVKCLGSECLTILPDKLLDAGVEKRYCCLKQPLKIQCHKDKVSFHSFPGGKFVKKLSLFMASDNLTLTPSPESSIGFLKELNVPLSDIEKRVILVSEAEALCILKSSLTSSPALTNSLSSLCEA